MSSTFHITLVRGPIVYADSALNNEATPSVAFAYLSAYLHSLGFQTTIVDAIADGLHQFWPLKYDGYNAHGLTPDQILAKIPEDTDIIGFSCMFSGEWPLMRDLVQKTRQQFPETLLVAGGEHITALTEYSLRDCSALDCCIRGEGEKLFGELAQVLSESGSWKEAPGVCYIDEEGEYRQNGGLQRIRKVDEIPWPHWEEGYLEKFWDAGKSLGILSERDMPFMFSRGCPFQCTFCSNATMWTTLYRLRDPDDVMEELKSYIERYNITGVQLYDLTAVVKKSWIVDFARRLVKEGIRLQWSLPNGTRSEALDEETLQALRDAGLEYIAYAPDSGSPTSLKKIKKKVNLDNLTESILKARKIGLKTRIHLIIGYPFETWKEVFETIRYGLKMAIKGVDEVPFYIYNPYPGTELFRGLQAEGKIEFSDEYFLHLTRMNSSFLSTDIVCHSPHIHSRLLGIVRVIAICSTYFLGYLLYPSRIFRTIRNLFRKEASTTFEHRLKDLLKRWFTFRKKPSKEPSSPLLNQEQQTS